MNSSGQTWTHSPTAFPFRNKYQDFFSIISQNMAPTTNTDSSVYSKELFLEILAKNGITDVVEVEAVIPPLHGEHFASAVYTVTATRKSGDKVELFVKKVVDNPKYAEEIAELQLFEREASAFTEVIPFVRDFIRRRVEGKGIEYELYMVPKCYYADQHMTVLENLTFQGFDTVDKFERHDFRHARACLQALAKYHAAYYVLLRTEINKTEMEAKFPSVEDAWASDSCKKTMGPMMNGMKTNIALLLDRATERPETAEQGRCYLNSLGDCVLSYINAQNRKHFDKRFISINHGDVWSNNWLFKDNGAEEDPEVRMVDYQVPRIASVTLDLGYYIMAAVQPKVRVARILELLRVYYDALVENLGQLDFEAEFNFEDLVADFKKNITHGFIIACLFVTMVKNFEAKKDINEAEGGFAETLGGSLESWLDENPEKTKGLIKDALDLFEEKKNFIGEE